jgi:predicted component of type VI protein secretion system
VMFFNSILCCKSKVPWQSGTILHLHRIQLAVESRQGINPTQNHESFAKLQHVQQKGLSMLF